VLTEVVRARAPGFSQLSWDLPLDAFATVLGAPEPAPLPPSPRPTPAPAPAPLQGLPASRAQSTIEVAREGHAYPGVYVAFRTAYRNSGDLVADLIVIWRQGDRLLIRVCDPSFAHNGEVFVIRHQLFVIGEDDQRVDGIISYLLNGVPGQKAYRIDGVMLSVANDRYRTPGAAMVILLRLEDLEDVGAPPPQDRLNAIAERMAAAFWDHGVPRIAGPQITAAAHPVVGAPGGDGQTDHLMRQPMPRSLSACETELTPALKADLERVRAAFLPDA
jgi:hypothetical protein